MVPEHSNSTVARSALRANLERLLVAGKDGPLLRFGLGQALLNENQPASAAEHLHEATCQDPTYSAAWKLLGKALERLDLGEAAEAAWREGLVAAERHGDLQSIKEISVFLKRRQRRLLA